MSFTGRRRDGFTLVELTFVALLLLIITGISIPLFKKSFSDLSAKDVSFNISKLINYAQEMAVLERTNFKITFDFPGGKYQLLKIDALSQPPVYKKAQGRFGRLFGLPQGLDISADKNEIVFYPDGHCDELKLNVLARNSGYSVAVERFGNMVRIKEVIPEQ